MSVTELVDKAKALSRREQIELLDELKCILGAEQDADFALTPAQASDLDRRIEEYRSGKAKVISHDEVVARLRKRS
jgi:putative addiction module component (TIGR02574 family)